MPIQGVVDHDRRLAAILAGAALVADLRRDPGQLGQAEDAVLIDTLALLEKVVVKLAVPLDLAAFNPSLLQQLGLEAVFLGPLAQRRLQPRIEDARLNAQAPTHRPDGELPAMLGFETRISLCIPGEIRVAIVTRTNGAPMMTLS